MLISGNAGAHEDDRPEEGNEIIHKPRSYFKNATDKALAGEVFMELWEFLYMATLYGGLMVWCIWYSKRHDHNR